MCDGPIAPDAPPAAIGGRRQRSQCVSQMRLGVPVWSPAVFCTHKFTVYGIVLWLMLCLCPLCPGFGLREYTAQLTEGLSACTAAPCVACAARDRDARGGRRGGRRRAGAAPRRPRLSPAKPPRTQLEDAHPDTRSRRTVSKCQSYGQWGRARAARAPRPPRYKTIRKTTTH